MNESLDLTSYDKLDIVSGNYGAIRNGDTYIVYGCYLNDGIFEKIGTVMSCNFHPDKSIRSCISIRLMKFILSLGEK